MIPVRLYTTHRCGYCRRATALLDHKRVPYEEIDCSDDREVRRWLVEQTGQRTVPQIFLDGVAIGGFDELHALERAGALDAILAGERPPPSVID